MGDHLTFEIMELNFDYECLKYRPVYAKWGLYYVIKIQKVGDKNKKTMIITNGCIFDKLEKIKSSVLIPVKFSFKKIEIDSLNNTLIDVITIVGDHDSVVLGYIFKY